MKHLDLYLHTGGQMATLDQIADVVTPQATDTWVPVPHINLIEQVTQSLLAQNYDIITQSHALARDGGHYFGLMQIRPQAEADNDQYGLVVGLRNSHTKVYPIGLVVGHGVFICDNLAFSGEIRINRKHTSRALADMPVLVHSAVGRIYDMHRSQEERIAMYQEAALDNRDAEHLIIEFLRAKIITTSQVEKVVNAWDTNEIYEPTAWRLFNNVTEQLKGRGGLAMLPRRTQALHGLLDSFTGFAQPTVAQQLEGMEDVDVMEAA